jgi:2-polyprenyl-3-methyl-5-hydroxy-6-metoxy-1,4-benzoquinol methylase
MLASYPYHDSEPTWANAYLWPVLRRVIAENSFTERRAFDLGCGNGATCKFLQENGFDVLGVDPSESGVGYAKQNGIHAETGSAYDDLATKFGTFPLVVSLEVIEHCYDPFTFTKTFLGLIAPGGMGFLTTPYHGYWKNLALAVSGKMDAHFTALWPHGHIKFFSIPTLLRLLNESGASDVSFIRVGRVPVLAKSLVALIRK